ncbi:MAG: LPS assembly protein LptD [Desulfobacterales bacterium]|nr:LPS assembly protein LptD [Desulfobacterales bacterium]
MKKRTRLPILLQTHLPLNQKKNEWKTDESSETEPGEPAKYDYRQFLWFKLEQSYDINEAREDNPQKWANQTDQRPFSPLKGDLEFYPVKYLSFDGDGEWCFYDDEFESYNAKVSLSDIRNDILSVEYRYTRDSIKSITADLTLKITEALTAFGGYEHNILLDQRIKTSAGFKYQSQCWSVGVGYTDEPDDRKYEFSINLYGLGEVGN